MLDRLSYYKYQNRGSNAKNDDFYKNNKVAQVIYDLKNDQKLKLLII